MTFRTQSYNQNFRRRPLRSNVGHTPNSIFIQFPSRDPNALGSLENRTKGPSRIERKAALDQIRCSEANRVVRIFIMAHLPRILNEVIIYWPILKVKMQNSV